MEESIVVETLPEVVVCKQEAGLCKTVIKDLQEEGGGGTSALQKMGVAVDPKPQKSLYWNHWRWIRFGVDRLQSALEEKV